MHLQRLGDEAGRGGERRAGLVGEQPGEVGFHPGIVLRLGGGE